MVYSGECPGEGIYVCRDCGVSIKLETDTTEMPECQNVVEPNLLLLNNLFGRSLCPQRLSLRNLFFSLPECKTLI